MIEYPSMRDLHHHSGTWRTVVTRLLRVAASLLIIATILAIALLIQANYQWGNR